MLFGLLLGAAVMVLLFRADLFDQDGTAQPSCSDSAVFEYSNVRMRVDHGVFEIFRLSHVIGSYRAPLRWDRSLLSGQLWRSEGPSAAPSHTRPPTAARTAKVSTPGRAYRSGIAERLVITTGAKQEQHSSGSTGPFPT
ncbi:hypothetical protein ACFCZT_30465 [Streptomyces sp. NPDC056230]|uniref:hypothetical protein n=1 Tax=Streptomyces sp. NPDC056230 TaxID=3345754 RepID=UPI0035DE8F9D